MKLINTMSDNAGTTADVEDQKLQTALSEYDYNAIMRWAESQTNTMPVELINGDSVRICELAFIRPQKVLNDPQLIYIGSMLLRDTNSLKSAGSAAIKVGKPAKGKSPYLCMDFSPTQFLGAGRNWKRASVKAIKIAGKEIAVDHTLAGYVYVMCELFSTLTSVVLDKEEAVLRKVDVTSYLEMGSEEMSVKFLNFVRGVGASRYVGIDVKVAKYYLESLNLRYIEPQTSLENYAIKFQALAYLNGNSDQVYGTVTLYNKGLQLKASDSETQEVQDGLATKVRIGVELNLRHCIGLGMLRFKQGHAISVEGKLASYEQWLDIKERYLSLCESLEIYGPKSKLLIELESLVNDSYGPNFFQRALRDWFLTVSNFRSLFMKIYKEEALPAVLEKFANTFSGSKIEMAKEILERWRLGKDPRLDKNVRYQVEIFKEVYLKLGFDPRYFTYANYRDLLMAQNLSLTSEAHHRAFALNDVKFAKMLIASGSSRKANRAELSEFRKALSGIAPTVYLTHRG
jgi:hypothetical protein